MQSPRFKYGPHAVHPARTYQGPFTLEEARAAGLTLSALTSKAWRRLGAELYCLAQLKEDPWQLLSTWQRSLPAEAVFAGGTAAWLFGLDVEPIDPVEIVVPPESGIRPRVGLTVRRCVLLPAEIVSIRGLRATALPLTLAGLCLRRPAVEALVAIHMAVRAGLTDGAALGRYAEAAMGRHGAGRLRALAAFAAPAESPMETRLRWLLIQAGLSPPEIQTNLQDSRGRFIGRADLYYPAAKLILEYDGGNHRERLVEDDRRQNLLTNAGFRLLRFTATDVYSRPEVIEAQVRGALTSGWSRGVRKASSRRSRTPRASARGPRRW